MAQSALMVVDMQEKFLSVPPNNIHAKNIPRLISNTCDRISDTLQKGEKVFVVKYEGCGENVPEIEKALNGKGIPILKDQAYFLVLEKKAKKYGIRYDAFDDITDISLSGVHTYYCVREAFRTLTQLAITPKLILGTTLNICHGVTSLQDVRWYYQMQGLKAQFTGYQEGKSNLEDYL